MHTFSYSHTLQAIRAVLPMFLAPVVLGFSRPAPAQVVASGTCSSGQVAISSPAPNYVIPSNTTVVTSASTGGGCDITAIRLYVDNQPYYTVPEGGSSGAGFNYPTNFGPGYHKLNAVAWNNKGYSFVSPGVEVFVAPQDETVYITVPAPGQTINGAVNIAARARWDNANISDMRVYVDNQDVYDSSNPLNAGISFQKTFSTGEHNLVVVAWNSYGGYIKAEENFTVQ